MGIPKSRQLVLRIYILLIIAISMDGAEVRRTGSMNLFLRNERGLNVYKNGDNDIFSSFTEE